MPFIMILSTTLLQLNTVRFDSGNPGTKSVRIKMRRHAASSRKKRRQLVSYFVDIEPILRWCLFLEDTRMSVRHHNRYELDYTQYGVC